MRLVLLFEHLPLMAMSTCRKKYGPGALLFHQLFLFAFANILLEKRYQPHALHSYATFPDKTFFFGSIKDNRVRSHSAFIQSHYPSFNNSFCPFPGTAALHGTAVVIFDFLSRFHFCLHSGKLTKRNPQRSIICFLTVLKELPHCRSFWVCTTTRRRRSNTFILYGLTGFRFYQTLLPCSL